MSNASHAKEPSMEEILASIRRIIESSDERPSLPGLSVTPRQPRVAPPETPPPAANAPAGAGSPTPAEAEPVATRLGALDDGDGPAPLRIFQPANGMLADRDPFEELAIWEFSPVDRLGAAVPVAKAPVAGAVAPTRSEEPSTSGPAVAIDRRVGIAIDEEPATTLETTGIVADVQAAALPLRGAASLAEAYGAARTMPATEPALPEMDEPQPLVEPAAAAPAADLAVAPDEGAETSLLVAATDDGAATESVARGAASASELDFSFEFDEDAFSEELRGDLSDGVAATEAVSSGIETADPFRAALPEEGRDDVPAARDDSFASLSSVMSQTSSLMSAEAGSQVAAAFDDLARAIRDGQMKSMEEMAREMLRPMLQEWLDDNLPRLVEKLVREEIERVARGGRR